MQDVNLTLVDSLDELDNFRRWMGERRPNNWLGIDTETTGFNFWEGPGFVRLCQIGDAKQGWAVPMELWKGAIRELVPKWEGDWVMHNAKFDVLALKADGIDIPWSKIHDTMVMAAIVAADKPKGLKPMSSKWLGPTAMAGSHMLEEAMTKNKWTWATVPWDCPPYWVYGALDPVLTAAMAEKLWPLTQYALNAYDIEMGALSVISDMEWRGIHIDLEYCQAKQSAWTAKEQELRFRCQQEWGVGNPTSNQHVYSRLQADGVQLVQFTPTGKPKLTKEILELIDHPLAQLVLDIRKLAKMRAAYLDTFIELVDEDGLIHASINPLQARTGRMSITRPGLQTLPRGRSIRDAFVPREGHMLLLSDYQQMELRVLAAYGNEEAMIEAFLRGDDLHTYTAQQVYQTDSPTRQQRQVAKNANFSKIYGAGIAKFSMTAGIAEDEGRAFLGMYDQLFPGVVRFQHEIMQAVMQRQRDEGEGYIVTFNGKRLPIGKGKEYVGTNYLIQGSCADIFKRKMCELDAAGVGKYMVLPVHDELVFDVPTDEVEDVSHVIEQVMSEREWFRCPLEVDIETAYRWGEKYADEDEGVLAA